MSQAQPDRPAREIRRYLDPLSGRHIALGVTGSIAAYKALGLASALTQAGALVDVILTPSAGEIIRPLAFQALTHRPVAGDLWESGSEMAMDHIALAHRADALLVAPATANTIAELALGLARGALGTTALACTAPLLLAPAMEPNMWAHPATRGHAASLSARGAVFIGPREGRMASGKIGLGRMAEPEQILDRLRQTLGKDGPLCGRRILVTAGPTREPLDPLRFLSNRSTGSMGLALARVARDLGAEVSLIHGPIQLSIPAGVLAIPVESAREMQAAVLEHAADHAALVMTAAVADYRPARVAEHKIKKQGGDLQLTLTRNPDILASLDQQLKAQDGPRPYRVGFAAETEQLEVNARGKLTRKGLDLVVANAVPASFGPGAHEAMLISQASTRLVQAEDKPAMAQVIMEQVVAALAEG